MCGSNTEQYLHGNRTPHPWLQFDQPWTWQKSSDASVCDNGDCQCYVITIHSVILSLLIYPYVRYNIEFSCVYAVMVIGYPSFLVVLRGISWSKNCQGKATFIHLQSFILRLLICLYVYTNIKFLCVYAVIFICYPLFLVVLGRIIWSGSCQGKATFILIIRSLCCNYYYRLHNNPIYSYIKLLYMIMSIKSYTTTLNAIILEFLSRPPQTDTVFILGRSYLHFFTLVTVTHNSAFRCTYLQYFSTNIFYILICFNG